MLQLGLITSHHFSFLPMLPSSHISPALGVHRIISSNFQHCIAATARTSSPVSSQTGSRNSTHYKKNIWTAEFVQSLKSDFMEETQCVQIHQMLKKDLRNALEDKAMSFLDKLELIDTIQRLGVGYHFEDEIKRALGILSTKNSSTSTTDASMANSLYSTALYFRLLREHGNEVSPDVFHCFKDEKGSFRAGLCNDIKGMLSLYEASHLCYEGEDMMHDAKAFTVNNLKLVKGNIDPILNEEVSHALELPLQWRMPRLESRWYIDVCQRSKRNINSSLVEFARLDFNMVQAIHQKDLTSMSRWWGELGVSSILNFARDRLVESFLWSVGLTYEPHYKCCREWLTKVVNLIIVIDDIYDIYGSIDELELFTASVERWDIDQAMELLPDYMKICFLALYNTTNEMVYSTLKEQGSNILPHLNKVWAEFCKAMLMEAKWSKSKSNPTLREYLSNAWISSSTPVVLTHAFFATKQEITKDSLQCLFDKQGLIHQSSVIFRLCNDLATSSAELERGDVPSAVQCYMMETKVSEQEARLNIIGIMMEMWEKLNKEFSSSPFSSSFSNIIKNHVRTAHSIYQRADGIGVQDHDAKERVMSLLVKTIT